MWTTVLGAMITKNSHQKPYRGGKEFIQLILTSRSQSTAAESWMGNSSRNLKRQACLLSHVSNSNQAGDSLIPGNTADTGEECYLVTHARSCSANFITQPRTPCLETTHSWLCSPTSANNQDSPLQACPRVSLMEATHQMRLHSWVLPGWVNYR